MNTLQGRATAGPAGLLPGTPLPPSGRGRLLSPPRPGLLASLLARLLPFGSRFPQDWPGHQNRAQEGRHTDRSAHIPSPGTQRSRDGAQKIGKLKGGRLPNRGRQSRSLEPRKTQTSGL